MNKKLVFLIILSVSLIIISTGIVMAKSQVNDEVLKAARAGLPQFLESIPAGDEAKYGFQSRSELALADLGTPFRIYALRPEAIENFKYPAELADSLIEMDEWFVPVTVGGERRALLKVAQMEGRWQAVGLSGAGLASEMNAFDITLPSELKAAGLPAVEEMKFVRVYQLYSDFLLLKSKSGEMAYPFRSARIALDRKEEGLVHVLDMVSGLHRKILETK